MQAGTIEALERLRESSLADARNLRRLTALDGHTAPRGVHQHWALVAAVGVQHEAPAEETGRQRASAYPWAILASLYAQRSPQGA